MPIDDSRLDRVLPLEPPELLVLSVLLLLPVPLVAVCGFWLPDEW